MSAFERVACLWLPEFALQVHRRQHPKLSGQKLAIVDRDHPLGKIMEIEAGASSYAVLPGMRYSQALSLDLELCCVVWDPRAVAQAQQEIARDCLAWTPDVECFPQLDGVVWLFYRGMQRLFPQLEKWGQALLDRVCAQGWEAKLSIGFGRRSSYAAARCQQEKLWVAPCPSSEVSLAGKLPLRELSLAAKDQKRLKDLGIYTLKQLWGLRAGALPDRFGPQVRQWHAMHQQDDWAAGRPLSLEKPTQCTIELEEPLKRSPVVIARIEPSLRRLADDLLAQGVELSGIEITFSIVKTWGKSPAHQRHEEIYLAHPGRDIQPLLRLLTLRLESKPLSAAVHQIKLKLKTQGAVQKQESLWGSLQSRDLASGEQALAVIRAELGNQAVQRAVLCDEHVPEQRFRWESFAQLKLPPKPQALVSGLVRRIQQQAQVAKGFSLGSWTPLWGPYVLEGNWWSAAIARKEYYVRHRNGFMQWVFFDAYKKSWFLQGEVG